ncbi:MAG: hypothetical protein VB858_21060 [Planctomycetaceae bacterium]
MNVFRPILCLTLALAITGAAVAEDKKETRKAAAAKKGDAAAKRKAAGKGRTRKAPTASQIMLRGIELTAEQKTAIAPIDKEFGAKLAELRKAQASILTDEQKKQQQAAAAKLRSAGKPATPEQRKELAERRKALASVIKLSDEQKAKQAELRKAQGALRASYLEKVSTILTDDQKSSLKKRGGKTGGKKPADGNKPRRKKKGADGKTAKDAA